jgi:enterochelin esterase-like enzyme
MQKPVKEPLALYPANHRRRQVAQLIPPLLAFVVALLGGVLLTASLADGLTSAIISLGLDTQRAQMLSALLLCAGAGLCGSFVGRRYLGTLPASLLLFWATYLQGFIQSELQPVRDPGGNLEPLNMAALVHTSLMLSALAFLCAFVGSAVGLALAHVLLDPVYQLLLLLRRRLRLVALADTGRIDLRDLRRPAFTAAAASPRSGPGPLSLLASWAFAALLVAAFVLAAGSGDLFIFAPDIGIHTPPIIRSSSGRPSSGTVVQDSLVSPALRGQRRSFLVYLPPSYNTPAGRQKRYPTLYLLHGSPGKIIDWIVGGKADQAANTLIGLGKIPELIMVFPDGNGRRGSTSEWGNSGDHRQLIESYVAVDLVHYVDSHYRTIASPADRAIGGNSMGGFGATNIAIHHPDVFGFVISLGGYYRAEGKIWGTNPAYLRANSPIDIIVSNRQSQHLQFFLGAATRDQPYYNDTLQFAQVLKRLHVRYTLDIEKGYHSWHIWQIQIYRALLWLHWG